VFHEKGCLELFQSVSLILMLFSTKISVINQSKKQQLAQFILSSPVFIS